MEATESGKLKRCNMWWSGIEEDNKSQVEITIILHE